VCDCVVVCVLLLFLRGRGGGGVRGGPAGSPSCLPPAVHPESCGSPAGSQPQLPAPATTQGPLHSQAPPPPRPPPPPGGRAGPRWPFCGETFPVGCRFHPAVAYSQYFSANPDRRKRLYNSPTGVYRQGCGLGSVLMSWGAGEYLHMVLRLNGVALPPEALFCIRCACRGAPLYRPLTTGKAPAALAGAALCAWCGLANGWICLPAACPASPALS
jgi:hypothetical protein